MVKEVMDISIIQNSSLSYKLQDIQGESFPLTTPESKSKYIVPY